MVSVVMNDVAGWTPKSCEVGLSVTGFYLAAGRGSVQIPIMPRCDLSEFLDNDEAHVVGRVGERP
jgi:hypothetical protein